VLEFYNLEVNATFSVGSIFTLYLG